MSDFKTQSDLQQPVDADTRERLNAFFKKRALYTSVGVALYIIGVAYLILLSASYGMAIKGVVGMLVMTAVATGLIVYVWTYIPYDLEPYVKGKKGHVIGSVFTSNGRARKIDAFMKLYWLVVTIIYLFISFKTFQWQLTWIIWLIAAAIKEAIYLFAGAEENEE